MGAGCGSPAGGEGKLVEPMSVVPGKWCKHAGCVALPLTLPGSDAVTAPSANGVAYGDFVDPKVRKHLKVSTLDFSNIPPPMISDTKLEGTADIPAILKANRWDTNVFDLSHDDCVLLMEALYEDLGLIEVRPSCSPHLAFGQFRGHGQHEISDLGLQGWCEM